MEFMEEDCSTCVVPLKRVLENVEAGQKVTVLWYDGKKYPALFLLLDVVCMITYS